MTIDLSQTTAAGELDGSGSYNPDGDPLIYLMSLDEQDR
jgi:hypothetical protein